VSTDTHQSIAAAGPRMHPLMLAVARGLVGALLVTLAYQLVHWSHIVDPRVLPSATAILAEMARLAISADYLVAVLQTLLPALLGLLVGAALAIPLGFLLGLSPLANRITRGTIDIMRSLPATALIPVLIVTVGQDMLMKGIVVVYVTAWPILFNTMYGALAVDKVAIESARTCRVAGWRLLYRVMLPSAGPFIATGIRYALPISIVIVIAAELVVGSPEGIGGYLLTQQANVVYRADVIYAVLLAAGIVGFVLNVAMDSLCDRLVGWETRRGEQS
jgi:NitT/TauT family transport system permease protein